MMLLLQIEHYTDYACISIKSFWKLSVQEFHGICTDQRGISLIGHMTVSKCYTLFWIASDKNLKTDRYEKKRQGNPTKLLPTGW